MAAFYSGIPVSKSVTASQDAQYHEPETEAVKWNSVIICLCAL